MRDDFRIAVFHQAMPARFQLRPLLEMVKQFAIENHDDATILIRHGLLAIREADNAQPARRQRHARLKKEALFIRAAMYYRTRHSADGCFGHGALPGEINNACDAAHDNFLLRTPPARHRFLLIFCRCSQYQQLYDAAEKQSRMFSGLRRSNLRKPSTLNLQLSTASGQGI
jgi:hypothetical protein